MCVGMLNLSQDSDAAWVVRALDALPVVLLDHAHCEKKAASTAMNLIFRYQKQPWLMRPLSELAREELEHFELMLGVLDDFGVAFEPLAPSAYARLLRTEAATTEPQRLVDTLLCCALIEARSCERMKALSEGATQPVIRDLYKSLLASEARHHQVYVDLAVEAEERRGVADARDIVRARLAELSAHEANVIRDLPKDARFHNG